MQVFSVCQVYWLVSIRLSLTSFPTKKNVVCFEKNTKVVALEHVAEQ